MNILFQVLEEKGVSVEIVGDGDSSERILVVGLKEIVPSPGFIITSPLTHQTFKVIANEKKSVTFSIASYYRLKS